MRLIACSRMYNVTQTAGDAWRELFAWVGRRTGLPVEVIDHPAPAPLEALWRRPDLALVFMCGWPFSQATPQPRIVAAPIPSPGRYGGRPIYFTDFVVRRDKGLKRLEDTFGGCLAWTLENSHSGFNAPRYHLLRYRSPESPVLYRQVHGPVVTPAAALASVIEARADVAPLDSYALDLIGAHDPGRLAGTVALDSTEPAPIPPLVASPGTDADAVDAMRAALLDAARCREVADVLAALCLKGFSTVHPSDYELVAERDRIARASGHPYPA
jgi:ABC-type phosphate/phosphonate transport system substrate-binding protein